MISFIVGIFFDQSLSIGKNIFNPDVARDVGAYFSGTGVWAFILHWTGI